MDSEDFIKGAWFFGISDFKREGQQFDFGFRDLFRETSGGAIDTDLDLSAEGDSFGILQFVEDSSANIFDEALELNRMTFITEVSAALVVAVRRPPARRAYGSERKRVPSVERILKERSPRRRTISTRT